MMKGDWRIAPKASDGNRRWWHTLIWGVIAVAAWLILWQIASIIVGLELLLPSPISCAKALLGMIPTSRFWLAISMSVGRVMGGYIIGCAIGALLGMGVYFIPVLGGFIKPALSVIRTTPVASFILLAVLWLTPNGVPMLIASLMVIPVVSGNVLAGLEGHSKQLREVAYVYGFSRRECFTRLFLPSALPYFSAGCMTSLGLAWKAGVAAEVLAVTRNSMGIELYYAKLYFETAELFAWTLAVILISFALEKAIRLAVFAVSKACCTETLDKKEERENG